MMRSEKEIRDLAAKLKKEFDSYGRKPARVDINAPRALIQTQMEAQERLLNWILNPEKERP